MHLQALVRLQFNCNFGLMGMPDKYFWSESALEARLKQEIELLGGECWKFTCPGTSGVPDRIILLPEGKIIFLEMKSTGFEPRKLQLFIHKLLRRLGFRVEVIDNLPDLLTFVKSL